jgi:hypothetical protein
METRLGSDLWWSVAWLRTRTRSAWLLLVGLLSSLMTAQVYAEVMDKEPSIADNWWAAILLALVAVLAWRWRWWAGAVVTGVFLLRVWGVWAEVHDPWVGPAIVREAGQEYPGQFYLSVLLGVAAHAGAAVGGIRKARRARREATK